MRKMMVKACLSLLLAGCCLAAQAQLPNAPSATSNAPETQKKARWHGVGSYLDKANAADPYEPLSAGGKFGFAARNAFGPLTYAEVAVVAGINQASNSQPSWGQGAEGFGKRYGAAFTDQAINTMVSQAVFPALFKQDPRYFRRASGSFGGRVGYALSRLWITRRDDGSRVANLSPILGAAVTAGVSRAYYPSVDRNAGQTMRVWGIQIASDAAWNEFYEFWPDVRHAIFKK
jgi:hypothetical protein